MLKPTEYFGGFSHRNAVGGSEVNRFRFWGCSLNQLLAKPTQRALVTQCTRCILRRADLQQHRRQGRQHAGHVQHVRRQRPGGVGGAHPSGRLPADQHLPSVPGPGTDVRQVRKVRRGRESAGVQEDLAAHPSRWVAGVTPKQTSPPRPLLTAPRPMLGSRKRFCCNPLSATNAASPRQHQRCRYGLSYALSLCYGVSCASAATTLLISAMRLASLHAT